MYRWLEHGYLSRGSFDAVEKELTPNALAFMHLAFEMPLPEHMQEKPRASLIAGANRFRNAMMLVYGPMIQSAALRGFMSSQAKSNLMTMVLS